MWTAGTHLGRSLVGICALGCLLWVAGSMEIFVTTPLLCLLALFWGSLQAIGAAYLLLTRRPSGARDHTAAEGTVFCLSFGTGLAAIGLAASPLTPWTWPGLVLVLGGVAMMAWSPQAFELRNAV